MKTLSAAIGLASVVLAGSAYATPGPGVLPNGTAIFSSFVTDSFNTNSVALNAPIFPSQGGSPVAQEFTLAAPAIISSLTFELADPNNPGDTGSILVYLVPDAGNTPSANGITLTNATLLGSILESSLTSAPSAITVPVSVDVSPGTDWIALVDTSTTTGALWERTGDLIGLDVGNNADNTDAGLYNAHVAPGNSTSLKTVTGNSLELQIDVPEPASLALLGASVMGLGLIRRRKATKSDV